MKRIETNSALRSIIDKAAEGIPFSGDDISYVLGLNDPVEVELLFEAARAVRREHFGPAVFLYGFLYVSTYCRNQCTFCYYRAGHNPPPRYRYRKETAEIVKAAEQLEESGVHVIDLTMGEDPVFFERGGQGFDDLVALVKEVKDAIEVPLMVSPGVVPVEVMPRLMEAGASWFACYQETHNRELFERLRPGQDYDARLDIKSHAQDIELLIEEGILLGVGETAEDIARSFEMMWQLDADQVRAMNFVPRSGTPMAGVPLPDPERELRVIALLRLMFPGRLIPASLDVEGLEGLKRRLDAGANVVTSIVPPGQGLAGVAQLDLDIDDARRTVEQVKKVLKSCGLRRANFREYMGWAEQCR
jgi:methylornithine synthase